MTKLMFVGAVAVGLAGCVGTAERQDVDCNYIERDSGNHYSYPNVRIDKLFGLDSEVLANTNLFPVTSNSWHHYELGLGKNKNGFTTCTVHLERNARTGRLALEYVELQRTLRPGADDSELLSECRNAVGWVNEKLGTDMEIDSLADLKSMLGQRPGRRFSRIALPLCHTSVYVDIAEGQQVVLAAYDAAFMKRNGECIEMSPAAIELTFRVGEANCKERMARRVPKTQKDGQIVLAPVPPADEMHGIAIGVDISEKLSRAVKAREKECPRKARPLAPIERK